MLDIGWPELIIVGAVTLVAVGPKELPKVMHTIGRFAGKARRMMLALEHHIDCIEHETDTLEEAEKPVRKKKPRKKSHDK